MSYNILKFEDAKNGCWVCTSHTNSNKGYIYKLYGGSMKPLHRLVWKINYGEIPDGHEIHHKCGNRSCCNIDHLECIPRKKHISVHMPEQSRILSLKATQRYKEKHGQMWKKAKEFWDENKTVTGSEMASKFGVHKSTALRWMNQWRKE